MVRPQEKRVKEAQTQMSILEIAGAALLAATAAAGFLIKRFLKRKLNDIDGVSDIFVADDENIKGIF